MGNFITGDAGDAIYNGITYSVLKWSGDEECKELNTTSTGDAGYSTSITGPFHMSGSLELCVDATTPETEPLQGGGQATLSLQVGNTAKSYSGEANITKCSIVNGAEDVVKLTMNWVFTGVYTRPS